MMMYTVRFYANSQFIFLCNVHCLLDIFWTAQNEPHGAQFEIIFIKKMNFCLIWTNCKTSGESVCTLIICIFDEVQQYYGWMGHMITSVDRSLQFKLIQSIMGRILFVGRAPNTSWATIYG